MANNSSGAMSLPTKDNIGPGAASAKGPTQQPASMPDRRTLPVLGASIDVLDMHTAVRRIATWAARRESRYVCICNAHSIVTSTQDAAFHDVIELADMATPDGAPVAWMLKRQGATGQRRVSGPELMLAYCEHAECAGEALYLYGSTQATLAALRTMLLTSFPKLRIAGAESPPYRPPTPEEDEQTVQRIRASGASTVWVSLGCPKQESWMAAHRGRVPAVMVGVGAAFDFHAGTITRAPTWMRDHALEWLFRLSKEPRRLWKRYLTTNGAFVLGAARQLMSRARSGHFRGRQ